MLKTISYILAVAIALFALYYSIINDKKIAYVDNVYLFENSKVKADVYKKLKKDQEVREATLDSIKNKIVDIEQKLNNDQKNKELFQSYNLFKEMFLTKKQMFAQEMDNLSREGDSKIWQNINLKIEDYGKKNHYCYILGANGQGSIMFADEAEAITEDVLKYINNSYDGIE